MLIKARKIAAHLDLIFTKRQIGFERDEQLDLFHTRPEWAPPTSCSQLQATQSPEFMCHTLPPFN